MFPLSYPIPSQAIQKYPRRPNPNSHGFAAAPAVQFIYFYPGEPALFEIVFLGTSASAPSIHRGLSAQVVIHNEHRFLIDCGEGTQRQILRAGIGFKRLNRILITHGHGDHVGGTEFFREPDTRVIAQANDTSSHSGSSG